MYTCRLTRIGRIKNPDLGGEKAPLKAHLSPFVHHVVRAPDLIMHRSPAMGHPPHVTFNDSISSLMFNLLKSLVRLFGVNSSSVPLKSLSE